MLTPTKWILHRWGAFTMHRLSQLTVRTCLKTHGQLEECKSPFINGLYSEFSTGEYEIGSDAGQCPNDRNHKPIYNNGLLYFIEVRGMREKAGAS